MLSNEKVGNTLREFVERVADNKITVLSQHLRPQVEFVRSQDKTVGLIGRYETLDEDLREFDERHQLHLRRLQYMNRSPRRLLSKILPKSKNYWPYYDARTMDLVHEIYGEDVETWI